MPARPQATCSPIRSKQISSVAPTTPAPTPTLLAALPGLGTPLVIQDKTFVDATTIAAQDPTWNWGTNPGTPGAPGAPVTGDLWFPHVYMPNQNPYDMSGANAMGRWDYGPWFWPIFNPQFGPIANPYAALPGEPPVIPGIPNPSGVPEGFMDTPLVNGTLYPTMTVPAGPARFRILNACNDRFLNLQLYQATGIVGVLNLVTRRQRLHRQPGCHHRSATAPRLAGDGIGRGGP